MGILSRALNKWQEDGFYPLMRSLSKYLQGKALKFQQIAATYFNTKFTIGKNLFESDWDVLVILDTCRVDALREVQAEYDFITNVDSVYSVGGSSPEWIAETFDRTYHTDIAGTAYLSANPYTKRILSPEEPHEQLSGGSHTTYKLLSRIDHVSISDLAYSEYLFNYEPRGEEGPQGHVDGHTPPRYVTERGISVTREGKHNRVILHYWQPHYPYIARAIAEGRDLKRHEKMVGEWSRYIQETKDRQSVWDAYLDELRYVLDDIGILVRNIDADRLVITADHGEAFGEFGEFGHQIGSLNPSVRRVPWVELSCTNQDSYSPTIAAPEETGGTSETSVKDQLNALGYLN